MAKPTIHEIKRHNEQVGGFYFTRDTLKFFGQRVRDFKVRVVKGRVFVLAPISTTPKGEGYGRLLRTMGMSFAEYNPKTGHLADVSACNTQSRAGVENWLVDLENGE